MIEFIVSVIEIELGVGFVVILGLILVYGEDGFCYFFGFGGFRIFVF